MWFGNCTLITKIEGGWAGLELVLRRSEESRAKNTREAGKPQMNDELGIYNARRVSKWF
jgi:hypothetical protein